MFLTSGVKDYIFSTTTVFFTTMNCFSHNFNQSYFSTSGRNQDTQTGIMFFLFCNLFAFRSLYNFVNTVPEKKLDHFVVKLETKLSVSNELKKSPQSSHRRSRSVESCSSRNFLLGFPYASLFILENNTSTMQDKLYPLSLQLHPLDNSSNVPPQPKSLT